MTTPWTRRSVIKAGGLMGLASVAAPAMAVAEGPRWRNWGGNLSSQPSEILAPRNEELLIEMVRQADRGLRPIGSGHSWSELVPTDSAMMTLDLLNGVISHDPETLQAEVWAGTKLFALGPLLEQVGQAMPNMSDINYQSLGGAIATSTHGTGAQLGSMSSYVTGLRLVTPDGEVIDCDAQRDAELFNAACNSLGALGVVTRFRLQNRESHRLQQQEYLRPTSEILDDIEPLIRDNQQFELFPIVNSDRSIVVTTNVAPADMADHIEDDPHAIYDLKLAFELTSKLPFGEQTAYNTALDLAFGATNRVGASYQVLAHPRTVRFMEMEYTVPAEHGVACLREVLEQIARHAPDVCFPLEYRYVKADETLIGMFSGQDGCSISVHQFADNPNWQDYLAMVEKVFHKYQGRPHWGKWHSLQAKQLRQLYPHWDTFQKVRSTLDPNGRMLNPHLKKIFGIG
jgi:FAD-linked oxidoreductase